MSSCRDEGFDACCLGPVPWTNRACRETMLWLPHGGTVPKVPVSSSVEFLAEARSVRGATVPSRDVIGRGRTAWPMSFASLFPFSLCRCVVAGIGGEVNLFSRHPMLCSLSRPCLFRVSSCRGAQSTRSVRGRGGVVPARVACHGRTENRGLVGHFWWVFLVDLC